MVKNNLLALGITLIIALIWLRVNDFIAHKGWVSGAISRKIIHIGTGPIYVLCWLLFTDGLTAPFLAAIVPLGITLQFALVGTGVICDPSAVEAMSRSGDRREILRGPLFYGIVFIILTILFWRTSPIGIVALMMLCGGDGMADLVGKHLTSARLPWSPKKSVIGSLAMFTGGFIFAVGVLWVFVHQGYFDQSMSQLLIPVGVVAVGCTLVESLPLAEIDNITVPLTAVLLGLLVF